MRSFGLMFGCAVAVGASTALAPAAANACGGTFCDSGPQFGTVDQTGETILFVKDDGFIEAHVQIQYDPTADAEKFAWIVPVPGIPEFSVSSQQLMVSLLNATVPQHGFQAQVEPCGGGDGGGWDGCSGTDSAGGTGSSGGTGGGDTGDTTAGGPEVVKEETIGAFQVTVLSGGTAAEVMQWLGDNGYQQDPAAEPILQQYLAEGSNFAAFKLVPGAMVDEIHPITLRYQGTDPMIPIRLTRIAAQEDMGIRVLFLGDDRFAPRNYVHVALNMLKLDWFGLGINYDEVVSAAIDEAGGRAFITEYAGPSFVVDSTGLSSELWDAAAFEAAAAVDVMDLLAAQSLYSCVGGTCQGHALVPGLLAQYLPVPDGVVESDFYGCLPCFEGLIDQGAWDAGAFAGDLNERIIAPGARALELLESWPYLTRLYTTMSAEEMTLDPTFWSNPDLLEDTTLTRVGTWNVPCSGAPSFWLPDGRRVDMETSAQTWPDIEPDIMPFAERIETIPPAGPPQIDQDNTELINALLEDWNNTHAEKGDSRDHCWDHDPENPDDEPDPWTTGHDVTSGGTSFQEGQASSCACTGTGAPPAPAALLLGLLGLRRRR